MNIAGRTYRVTDNGRAQVLEPVDPHFSPAELAQREEGIRRLGYLADSPLGSAAYLVATAAKASPKVRDAALMAGSVADQALLGIAARGAPRRTLGEAPAVRINPQGEQQAKVRYRRLNPEGQAMGVNATLTAADLGTGTRTDQRHRPPGFGDKDHRGHLLARQLGGSGYDPRNIVSLTPETNQSDMQVFDKDVARRLGNGEVIEHSVIPLYRPGALPPTHILMSAHGSRGNPKARIVRNPAGYR
jgi:hypothetical protein